MVGAMRAGIARATTLAGACVAAVLTARIRASMVVLALLAGAASLGPTASAGPPIPCDDLARRLDGQSPRGARALWNQIGVSSRLFADGGDAPLRATLDSAGRHAVVSLSGGPEGDWQYLVFARRPEGCRLVGALDLPAQAPEPPSYRRVILPQGQTALAVRALARRGTGLALVRETWYLLDSERLAVVLQYPLRGHMVGWPSTFDRSFTASAVPRSSAGVVDEVRVDFLASYTSGSYIHWMPVEPLFE